MGKTIEQGVDAETIQRYKGRIVELLNQALTNKIDMLQFYREAGKLEDSIGQAIPDFWDNLEYSNLHDFFGFVERLHDSSTRKYHETHKSDLESYIRMFR